MPSPAIVDHINRTTSGVKFQLFDDGLGHVVQAAVATLSPITSRFDHVRPASVSTAPTRGYPRAPTNWSHMRSLVQASPATVTFSRRRTRAPGLNDWVGDVWQDGSFWNDIPVVAFPSVSSSLISRAEIAALLKLQNQHVHLGNFLAELKETVGMFTSTTSSIANAVTRFRRSNSSSTWQKIIRTEGSRFYHEIPGSWLQLQYGWNPLMSDINGALGSLGNPQRPQVVSVKGRAKNTSELVITRLGQYGSSQRATLRAEQRVEVGLCYSLSNPFVATLSQLGLLNPAEIVWEKLPYSFVVDWFAPVSSYLQALCADAGWAFISGYRTQVSKVTRIDFQEDIYDPSGFLSNSGKSPWSCGSSGNDLNVPNSFSFLRTIYHSSPVPGFYFKNPVSPGHIANAMSLLVQAFK